MLALHPVVTLMGVCMVRIAYRMLYEHARSRITGGSAEIRRALVLGAGDAAKRLLAGIHQQGWTVLGLLDDDPAKQRARIAGVPVLGPLEAVRDAPVRGAATHIVIAMPSATPAQRRRALELAAATGLPVLTVPSAAELRRRPQRASSACATSSPKTCWAASRCSWTKPASAPALRGKTVLITGAGGSIGSELCRQVARFEPARLVLYELSEFNLYSIEQELGETLPAAAAGAADRRRARTWRTCAHTFARWRPQVVFHAAAYKHVPLMEERATPGPRCATTRWAPTTRRWPRPKRAPSASC